MTRDLVLASALCRVREDIFASKCSSHFRIVKHICVSAGQGRRPFGGVSGHALPQAEDGLSAFAFLLLVSPVIVLVTSAQIVRRRLIASPDCTETLLIPVARAEPIPRRAQGFTTMINVAAWVANSDPIHHTGGKSL